MIQEIILIILSALFMIFFFGFCIFIHELGHFLAARWRGLTVTAFSIGFRKIWSRTYNGVEYRIGWIPFGGYVEIPQLDPEVEVGKKKEGEEKEPKKVYPPAKPLDRLIAVFAGPLFNILFGFLLAIVIWIAGIYQDSPRLSRITVGELKVESPEYKAGLRNGDVIYTLNGKKFRTTWSGFVKDILFTVDAVRLGVERNGKTFEISYIPIPNPDVQPTEGIAYPFFRPRLPVQVSPSKDGPGFKAGLRQGDVILEVDGKKVSYIDEFTQLLMQAQGNPLTLKVKRGEEILTITGLKGELKDAKAPPRRLLGFVENPVKSLLTDYPMEKAGVKKGDKILSVNGTKVETIPEIQKILAVDGEKGKNPPVKIVVERNGKKMDLTVTPFLVRDYRYGLRFVSKVHPTPWQQFTDVIDMTLRSMRGIGISMGRNLRLTEKHTTIKPKHMSGPLGIGRVLFLSVYRSSFIHGLSFVVLISFSLGLLNLLPIPVLDGGHILLAFLEIIFRRPIPQKFLNPISYVFIFVLIGFMLFVSFYDVKRIYYDVTGPGKKKEIKEAPKSAPAAENPKGAVKADGK